MPQVRYQPFFVGDQKPLDLIVQASDNSRPETAALVVNLRSGPANPIPPSPITCGIAPTRSGYLLTTPNIPFMTVGAYDANWTINWSDGQVDNSVTGVVQVRAVPPD